MTTDWCALLAATDIPRPLTTCTDRSPKVTGSDTTAMSHLPRAPSHCSDVTFNEKASDDHDSKQLILLRS